jgi:hypothetical protein
MGIEHLSKPPGVIHRDPLHRYEPGIVQMTKQLGDRLDLPSAIAAKYQRTVQTSSLNTLGHRLQRKEAIGPADSELINGFGHRSSPAIPELSVQTPQIARQGDVVVPVQETTTQALRIRRSPQGRAGGEAGGEAMAGPLNPPILGDFEPGSTARAAQPLADVAAPVQETTTQTFRIRRSPQGGAGGQAIATTMAGPLNPPSLGDFEPGSMARSPQNWGLGGDPPPQAETIVQRKVQTQAQTEVQTTAQPGVSSEVQTTTPTLVHTITQPPTSLQRSPTSPQPLQRHRQPQTDAINRYAIDSSEVLQQPPTTPQSKIGAIQRSVEGSPLVLHSQAIVQRLPNDGYTTIPSDQRIAPAASRSETSAPSPDITGLVDHISRIMARQLAVERERRGL